MRRRNCRDLDGFKMRIQYPGKLCDVQADILMNAGILTKSFYYSSGSAVQCRDIRERMFISRADVQTFSDGWELDRVRHFTVEILGLWRLFGLSKGADFQVIKDCSGSQLMLGTTRPSTMNSKLVRFWQLTVDIFVSRCLGLLWWIETHSVSADHCGYVWVV